MTWRCEHVLPHEQAVGEERGLDDPERGYNTAALPHRSSLKSFVRYNDY